MNPNLDILLIAVATLFSSTTAEGITACPDFQVLDGAEARFSWSYDGDFDITSGDLELLNIESTEKIVAITGGTKTILDGYVGKVGLDQHKESMTIVFTIFKATNLNTGRYKIDLTFSSDTHGTEITQLTVITPELYDKFRTGSSLKINNQQTVASYDSKTYDVAPGEVTLASTVPDDYTQTTTCTLTSYGMRSSCGTSCSSLTCTYIVYDTKPGDIIDLKILLDGFKDQESYGYTLVVDGSKTALASNQQASLLYITLMIMIVWICG